MSRTKTKVYLVIQNAWDTELLTMPLALGCLKATVMADADIRRDIDVRIFNYPRRASVSQIALQLFDDPPDVLGFSVLGWNYQNFGHLAETFRQVQPSGWCVFGGNHASHQAKRIFRMNPWVDIIVNGEGELTFLELLRARLAGRARDELADIHGLSIRMEDGSIVTTPDRERMRDLDRVPSPFLTGAVPLFGADGRFLYDVALMETNRGCPYKCSFCYWGGAVGQKIYSFSRGRLQEELDFFARHKVENICLCDSNFGMLAADVDFVADLVETRRRYGYPRNLVTSWAKNKNKAFYEIVKILKDTGFHSDFTLSLQTLNPVALEEMQRKNMKINDFEDLCAWLRKEGMSAHAELIWGVPGETCESFIEGYDRVAKHIARVATYPLCVLPNTDYSNNRDKYSMVTVRDTASDFEFVLSHSTVSLKDNRRMHHFLFWARLTAEYQLFRHVWTPLRELAGIKQSEVMLSLDRWFAGRHDAPSVALRAYLGDVVDNFDITRITAAVLHTYLQAGPLEAVFRAFWHEEVLPRTPAHLRDFFGELFEYDWLTRPVHDDFAAAARLPKVELFESDYYVRSELRFAFDMATELARIEAEGAHAVVAPSPIEELTLYYRTGFGNVADSHEFVPRYTGKTLAELRVEEDMRARGLTTQTVQPHVVGFGTGEASTRGPRRLDVLVPGPTHDPVRGSQLGISQNQREETDA